MPRVVISDHALMRFIERVHGVNLEPVKAGIAAQVQRAADLGAVSVTIDGFKYILEHNTAEVTVVSTVIRREKRIDNYAARGRGDHDGDT